MRAQVSSVGRLKNMRDCADVAPVPATQRSVVERARLELAVVVEQEGLDELPRPAAAATRRRTARRGAPRRSASLQSCPCAWRGWRSTSMRRTLPSALSSISSTGIASSGSGTRAGVGAVGVGGDQALAPPAGAPRPSCARARRRQLGRARDLGAASRAAVAAARRGRRRRLRASAGARRPSRCSRRRAAPRASRSAWTGLNAAHGRSPRPVRARCLRRVARSSTLARRHAAHAAEALQQARALLRADAGDVLEPAAAGAHAGAARAHAGDREAVRLVADLRHQHQRRRVAAEVDLRRGRRRTPAPRGRPCGPRPSRRRRSATGRGRAPRTPRAPSPPGRGRRRPAPGRAVARRTARPRRRRRAPRPAWRSGASAPGASRRSRRRGVMPSML